MLIETAVRRNYREGTHSAYVTYASPPVITTPGRLPTARQPIPGQSLLLTNELITNKQTDESQIAIDPGSGN